MTRFCFSAAYALCIEKKIIIKKDFKKKLHTHTHTHTYKLNEEFGIIYVLKCIFDW